MPPTPQQSDFEEVERIDAISRAMKLWVTHQIMERRFNGEVSSAAHESGLAAGFLAGLCIGLHLNDRESLLVAYSYCLKRQQLDNAASTARTLLTPVPTELDAFGVYIDGRQAALSYTRSSGV